MKRKILLYVLLFVSITLRGNVYFKHLGKTDGLSQISVISICQDELGRMWFGTLEGLSFYDGADELFMRKDLMAHVMAKINELPEKRREIFLLSYMEGLKAAEIAERLNLSTRTVENQLYRTLLFLRKELQTAFVYLFMFV